MQTLAEQTSLRIEAYYEQPDGNLLEIELAYIHLPEGTTVDKDETMLFIGDISITYVTGPYIKQFKELHTDIDKHGKPTTFTFGNPYMAYTLEATGDDHLPEKVLNLIKSILQ